MKRRVKSPKVGLRQGLAVREIEEREKEWLREYGFYIHYVIPMEESDSELINCHTHGLKESFGHEELQVVLPINQRIVSGVIHSAVNLIRKGKKFSDGDRIGCVLEGYDVLIKRVLEDDRVVMRLILPDAVGKFPGDEGCGEYYRDQASFDTRDLK